MTLSTYQQCIYLEGGPQNGLSGMTNNVLHPLKAPYHTIKAPYAHLKGILAKVPLMLQVYQESDETELKELYDQALPPANQALQQSESMVHQLEQYLAQAHQECTNYQDQLMGLMLNKWQSLGELSSEQKQALTMLSQTRNIESLTPWLEAHNDKWLKDSAAKEAHLVPILTASKAMHGLDFVVTCDVIAQDYIGITPNGDVSYLSRATQSAEHLKKQAQQQSQYVSKELTVHVNQLLFTQKPLQQIIDRATPTEAQKSDDPSSLNNISTSSYQDDKVEASATDGSARPLSASALFNGTNDQSGSNQ